MAKLNSEYKYLSPPKELLLPEKEFPTFSEDFFEKALDYIILKFGEKQINVSLEGVTYHPYCVKYKLFCKTQNNEPNFVITNFFAPLKIQIRDDLNASHVDIESSSKDYTVSMLITIFAPLPDARNILSLVNKERSRENAIDYCWGIDRAINPVLLPSEKFLEICFITEEIENTNQVLKNLFVYLAYNYTPNDIKVVLVDCGEELKSVNDTPFLLFGKVVDDKFKTYHTLNWLKEFFAKREELLNKANVSDIYAYNAINAQKLPEILLIINDVYNTCETTGERGKQIKEALDSLIDKGDKLGLRLWIVNLLHPSNKGAKLFRDKANLKVAYHFGYPIHSLLFLKTKDGGYLNERNDSIFVYENGENDRVVPYLTTSEEFNKVCDFIKAPDYPYYEKAGYEKICNDWQNEPKEELKESEGVQQNTNKNKSYILKVMNLVIDRGSASFFSLYLNFHKEFSGKSERQVLNDIVDELVALGYLVKENNLYKPTITKKQLYEIFGDDED